jgi:hypothetical protein
LVFGLGLGVLAWAYRREYPEQAAAVVDIVMDPIKSVISGPRGMRNNNPGNIVRTGDQWRGMAADQSSDSRFVVFDSPVWGLRALARVLRKYTESGAVTVRDIVSRWAPPVENDTGAYVAAVAARVGVSPTQTLALTDDTVSRIMEAIVQHENGQQPYSPELFAQAIALERSA